MGLASDRVELVSYSKEWRVLFQEEKHILKNLLGNYVQAIIHIGSTSIPNMVCAKPVVDIAIGVSTEDKMEMVKVILLENGYYHNQNAGCLDRLYFAKGEFENRLFNIHVEIMDGVSWNNHMRFKNFLLNHRDYIEKYCEIKRNLVEQYPTDRLKYTEGKAEFIQFALSKANAEYELKACK